MNRHTVQAVRHIGFEDLGSFEIPLREAGYDIGYVDVAEHDPGALDPLGADLLVILGGLIGVYDHAAYPFVNPLQMARVEQGGVLAIANIRGGGEYGRAWHMAGQFEKRQNAYGDFAAAGDFLKAERITSAAGLAIQGESNGGLLVGAVVNQRPDLFAAALPGIGVMDMLRYHRFSGGVLWMSDFGNPDEEQHFNTLLSYSPYHNIREGQDHPAILATTADTDDRVVPGHTFKYVAALQAADLGSTPMLDEYPGEYLVRRVSDLVGDLRDRKVRQFEKLAGSLHSQSRQVEASRTARVYTEILSCHLLDVAHAIGVEVLYVGPCS